MEARQEVRPERRWIPAFAGMTPGKGAGLLCSATGDPCPPISDVIPAKAGIHGSRAGLPARAQRKRERSGTGPDFMGRDLRPLFRVMPAMAAIHAFGSARRRRDINTANGNNP
jgi:hypothetical protein